jgi:hypothetical protein
MPKLYEALAEAFLAEGVDTQFVLLGDGNMHWSNTFAKLAGVHTVHVRHEHSTVAAATAYNVATGKVAVASVTCGPGVTQVMTALPAAVRARLPVVVFAGESPINAKFYNQYIDQAPLVTATGAHYIAAHSVPRIMDYVRCAAARGTLFHTTSARPTAARSTTARRPGADSPQRCEDLTTRTLSFWRCRAAACRWPRKSRPSLANVLMNFPSLSNFTMRELPNFGACPSATKMSPLLATATPVG